MTNIGNYAFEGCWSLTSVTIGSGITGIGSSAFAQCYFTDVTCLAESVPNTESDAFADSYIEYTTLHVPETAMNDYKTTAPWSGFGKFVTLTGEEIETPKCAKPTISYQDGKLTFSCATEGAVCQSTITDSDITSYSSNEVQLDVTYNISVYATKAGYENSETATATLCWIDVEPQTEGIATSVAQVRANAVLIQSESGRITVNGVDDGTNISVYSTNGVLCGTAISHNGHAVVNTTLQSGSVAIVKIGERSVKILTH